MYRRRYGNKSKFQRKFKNTVRTRKVASGKASTNVVKLQRQVSTIRRSLYKKAINCQYISGTNMSLGADFGQFNLTQYASWSPCFGVSVVDGTDNKAYYKNCTIDCRLTLQNSGLYTSETDTVDYTVFLVSLRDEASNVWNQSNGTLTLSSGRDYTDGAVAGMMVRLNPKMFKIHRMKRITTTNFSTGLGFGTAAGPLKPIVKWTWKINPRRSITNPIGDWSALAIDRDPSKNYYVLAFNNNSLADGEAPVFSVYGLHTVQVQGA